MSTASHHRRATPRVEIVVAVTFARARAGADVEGRTHDLGPGGMRVATRRPLKLDEQLVFALLFDDGTRLTGRAHVVREHACDVYGLRFDHLAASGRERLETLTAEG